MATGGLRPDLVDSRVTCSICLEPYKGRCPKLLPCFHTFCLPCLTQLADREASRALKVLGGNNGEQGKSEAVSPVITCPTCRTPTSLPPGGVTKLQTNFYLDDAGDQDDPRPLLCDLCEQGQTAKYTCTQCPSNFCSRCRRVHDKLCKSSLVSEIKPSCGSGDRKEEGGETRDQLQAVEDVLKKLAEEEERLAQERRAREHDIHVRYATLLRHAGEARDASLVSLRDVTQALSDALQRDVTLARGILHRMKQNAAERQPYSFTSSEGLTEANRRHFQELLEKKEEEALLKYNPKDRSTQSLIQALRYFMSRVVAAGQDSENTLDTDLTDLSTSYRQLQSSESVALSRQSATPQKSDVSQVADVKDLASKLKNLTAKCSQSENFAASLQTQNALLCRDMASVNDKNARLCADLVALQTEMTSMRDKSGEDLASLKRDLVGVRDKNCLLGQENQQLRDDLSTVQTDQAKLQADHSKLLTDFSKLQTDQNKLQTNQDKLQKDQDKLHTHQDKLQADHDQLQTNQHKLQADQGKLQTKQDKLQTNHDNFASDLGTLKNDVGHMTQSNSKLGLDVASVQDWLKKENATLTSLETRLSESSVQVAFHARLVTSRREIPAGNTLVCDDVITSVGGGYDDKTGVFTAPVSGLYCFMATASPFSDDPSKHAKLDLVLDGKIIGYTSAYGKGKCTTHAVVQVKAGQRVCLKTFGPSTFDGESNCFTGMLLQAEF